MRAIAMAPLEADGRPWWIALFEDHEHDIFPAGRTFDAPFLTLLRDDPTFFWWELITYARLAKDMAAKPEEVEFFEFPGLFYDTTLFGLTYIKEFGCHLVVGPIPMRDKVIPHSADSCPISLYCRHIEAIAALPNEGAKRKAALSMHTPSEERLNRMFYFGGTFSRGTFRDCARRAVKAIRHSCRIGLTLPSLDKHQHATEIDVADAASTGALFMERVRTTARGLSKSGTVEATQAFGALTPVTIAFRYSGRVGWKFSWSFDEGAARPVVTLAPLEHDQTLFERTADLRRAGKPDETLGEMLDDLMERTGDRRTQDMLQQLAIGKNWIHDRFAQFSGMTPSALAAPKELLDSANKICRWLLRLFDADITAIYQLWPSGDGMSTAALKQFGRAHRREPAAITWSIANQASMFILENAPEKRCHSICYGALWERKAIQRPNWDGTPGVDGMYIHERPDIEDTMRTAIAVPMKLFGRVWGIIELAGFTPNQFDRVDPIWLEEFGTLIVDQLFHTSMLAEIYQINQEILWDENRPDEPEQPGRLPDAREAVAAKASRHTMLMDRMCERMARIFMADGAALWLEDENWPGQYELQGMFGIIEEPYRKEPGSGRPPGWGHPRFDRGDTTSLSIRAINSLIEQIEAPPTPSPDGVSAANARRRVFQERTEEPVAPEDPSAHDARYEYHKRQWESGIRHVAVIPLLVRTHGDQRATAMGTIALFTKDHRILCPVPKDRYQIDPADYSDFWIPLMDLAGSQAAMLVRALRLETHRQNQIELMFSHQVMSKVNRISDQFSKLQKNVLEKLFGLNDGLLVRMGFDPEKVENSKAWAERVSALSQTLTAFLEQMRIDGFLLQDEIDFRTKKSVRDKPAKIFDVLKDAFNSRNELQTRRRLSPVMYIGNAMDDQLQFASFTKEDIANILENLADNAIKYTAIEKSIRVAANLGSGTLEIVVSNMGNPFTHEENIKLFKRGFRGQAAWSSKQSGSGNGLYTARTLALQIGADLLHRETPVPPDPPLAPDLGGKTYPGKVFHSFRLLITDREVIRDVR